MKLLVGRISLSQKPSRILNKVPMNSPPAPSAPARSTPWHHIVYRDTNTHLAGRAGELFYASGEVAVKAPHASASSHAPLLALWGARPPGSGSSQPPPLQPPGQQASTRQQHQQHQQQEGVRESARHEDVDVDIEVQLKEATESLSVRGARVAELAREATQARFELEDEQVALATAKTKVGTRVREMGEVREVERQGEAETERSYP